MRPASIDPFWTKRPLLAAAASAKLDAKAIASGIGSFELMRNAGRAVAQAIRDAFPSPQGVVVLCGPGNNGGDGWVAAAELAQAGWPVQLVSLIEPEKLAGDAATARGLWQGPIHRPHQAQPILADARIVVDALFGVGLKRDLTTDAANLVEAVNRLHERAAPIDIIAIDMPSGIDADTGAVRGIAVQATRTISFVTAKPGHLLLPGRLHCGVLEVADIGIDPAWAADEDQGLRANAPPLWIEHLPRRTATSHKYDFGHALVYGGPIESTGAARLAAMAALRIGAGLVSIATTSAALPVYAISLVTVMTKVADDETALASLLQDKRLNAVLIGPGAGTGERTQAALAAILSRPGAVVLDADALTALATRQDLQSKLSTDQVLTPHEGEFKRLFPSLEGSRLERAREASRQLGSTLVLKGSDTIVAMPDGRVSIMAAAPPSLATAGTGDVLAGLIAGLLAQHMPPFEAASAGVWLHAAGALRLSQGLIAEDLPSSAAAVLAMLATRS